MPHPSNHASKPLAPAIRKALKVMEHRFIHRFSNREIRSALETFLTAEPDWVQNAIARDPALSNKPGPENMMMMYKGMMARAFHYEAHALYEQAEVLKETKPKKAAKLFLQAHSISESAKSLTQIEIHEGATIGTDFFIDHGTGVVIGETAEIGNNVFLYHDVTLGAAAKRTAEVNPFGIARRHPRVGNNVTLSKGTSVLGPITLGNGTSIASSAKLEGMIETGENVRIGKAALIRSSSEGAITIGNNARIGSGAQVHGNITIGDGALIEAGVTVRRNIAAGEHFTAAKAAAEAYSPPKPAEKSWVARSAPPTASGQRRALSFGDSRR